MTDTPDVPSLLDIWQEALLSVADLCDPLTQEQWLAPTPCPGWTVADVAAHVTDIEQLFGGEPRPDHSPDWSVLPHVTNEFSQMTEVGVDVRRGVPKDVVLAELRATIERRRAQLDALPTDAEVFGPSGGMEPLSRFLMTRTFDTWVHEQDIRAAVGEDGGWGTDPAHVASRQMIRALPYVWGRTVKAPAGSTVRVTITGPGVEAQACARVGDDGRGAACDPVEFPTVDLVVTWPDFMALSCGRTATDDPGLRDRMTLSGDPHLCEALLAGLSITP